MAIARQSQRAKEKGHVSPATAAMRQTTPRGGQDEQMQLLLAEARKRVQAQMQPAQIEDPGDEDLRLAEEIIGPLVETVYRQARMDGARMTRSQEDVVRQIVDDIFGFGPLAPYLADEEVEEIIVNGPDDVWIIHAGRGKEKTGARFRGGQDVVNFVNRAASATSGARWLDRANPKVDARMRDGSRLHAVAEPLTVNVPIAVTIRRHRLVARTLEDLVNLGTVTPQVGDFLRMAVQGRLNVVVAGGTASGKCLTGDQPVVLGDGSRVAVGDLVERQFASRPVSVSDGCSYVRGDGKQQALTWNPRSGEFERASILAYTRDPAPTRLVHLIVEGGREITVTEAHPFFVRADDDTGRIRQVMSRDLMPGLAIAAPATSPRLGELPLPDVAWALVEAVEPVERHAIEYVYDLVVSKTHTFVAGSGAGIVAHNTNFLNAMCDAADDGDRFVLIEDTPELQVDKADVIQLTTRDQAEGAAAFTMADLLVESLRMRPDRIVTGEARGAEIVDVLMAANTGHDGQLLTIHANSTRDVIQRMETMYLLRGTDVPLAAIRRQIADAFQLVVYLRRIFIGNQSKRFVTEIAEMQPSQFMEGDKVVVQNIYEDSGQGLAWTGYYPERLARRLKQRNVDLRPQFFRRSPKGARIAATMGR